MTPDDAVRPAGPGCVVALLLVAPMWLLGLLVAWVWIVR